tara:strand:- start:10917 stop:11891 length:975 start_codon:yes stop_codon:yes gene_type:complete
MDLSEIETRFRDIKERYGKSVKDTTVRNNAKMIAKIMNAHFDVKEVWMKPDMVTEWIDSNNFSKTTQRNYYSLMLAMANWEREFSKEREDVTTKNVTKVAEVVSIYIEKIRDLEKQVAKDKKERKVSDKKVEQQVAPSMVYDIIDGLRENDHDAEALILEILMKYPYRAEVGTLKLLTEIAQYNYLKKKGKNTENYLVLGKRKVFVSRSDYKTFDQYGTIENEIKDPQLKKHIREYVANKEIKPMEPLFGFTNKQDVSKRLGYITKKLSGVSLGPAAVVKIMLSNQKFKGMSEAADFLKESSRIRGTALSVLQDVYLHKAKLED